MIKLTQKNTGKKIDTEDIQKVINSLGDNEELILDGNFTVGPLFLKSNMVLNIVKNSSLSITTDEALFPLINTRVAGIEMKWYPALINIIGCKNIKIIGEGVLNGNGPYWYNKYWGTDTKGGMRKEYDSIGLRWACDYDCMRPRNILIQSSEHIYIGSIISFNSGFWNLHILYSNNVIVDGFNVDSNVEKSPSTDGIDIDSSHDVIIQNVVTKCNDDSICIKSGRDYDGLLVNKPSYNIEIRNCKLLQGFGITMGSECSGGIYNIDIHDIEFHNTSCGFRIKSSEQRRGYIKNIRFSNVQMINVEYLFHIFLDWNRGYSVCKLPKKYNGEVYPHYKKLLTNTSGNKTIVSDIEFANIKSNYSSEYNGINRVFTLIGFENQPITNIKLNNVDINAKEYGVIENTDGIMLEDCNIEYKIKYVSENDDFDNR